MIAIPRGLARSFRAAARKCTTARTRAPLPPVSVVVAGDRLTLSIRLDDKTGRLTPSTQLEGVALTVEAPHVEGADQAMIVPMAVLDAVEGAAVELSFDELEGTARWEGRDGPRTTPFTPLEPGPQYEMPPRPATMQPVPATFLTALHECGRTTAREPTRFAIHRVQLDGQTGKVIGTSGNQALIWGGFLLPFTETVLVPAVPVFGVKDLGVPAEVSVGRTDDAVVVQAGAWSVWLTIDPKGRFPDVASVIPRSHGSSRVNLDDRDTADLLAALPGLPGAEAEAPAVTLDLDGTVTVRGRNEESGEVREARLERSSSTGPEVRIAVDRRDLARAVGLGCRSLRLLPGRPLVAEGPDKTFVVVTLGAECVVSPPSGTTLPAADSPVLPPEPERRMLPMKSLETNGPLPPPRPDPAEGVLETLDPLAEAEGLRAALVDVAARAGRLVQGLKQFKRQTRVLRSAWSSLQSLAIGPGGGES